MRGTKGGNKQQGGWGAVLQLAAACTTCLLSCTEALLLCRQPWLICRFTAISCDSL